MSLSLAASAVAGDALPRTRGDTTVACFSVVAAADPGVLPRVINVLAKRGLVPHQCYAAVAGPGGADLHIDLQVAGLAPALRDVIAETLRQVVAVDTVLTSERVLAGPVAP